MAASPYDDIAEWYDAWLSGDPFPDDGLFPFVEELLGDVAGKRIYDLACGQGRATRRLAELGARVVGVDLSARLLDIARRHGDGNPLAVDYIHADACGLDSVADGVFDGVLCHMALMDIADLDAALRAAARVLRPGGWFVCTILHPCFNPPPSGELLTADGWMRTVSGYWSEGYWRSDARTGPPGKVGSYHRTLATYLNALVDAGFMLECMREPRAEGRLAERCPIWAEVPAFLALRCRKDLGRLPIERSRR